jgi:hypothetical protein
VHVCVVAKSLELAHDEATSLDEELRTAPPDTEHVDTGAVSTSKSTDTGDTAARQ